MGSGDLIGKSNRSHSHERWNCNFSSGQHRGCPALITWKYLRYDGEPDLIRCQVAGSDTLLRSARQARPACLGSRARKSFPTVHLTRPAAAHGMDTHQPGIELGVAPTIPKGLGSAWSTEYLPRHRERSRINPCAQQECLSVYIKTLKLPKPEPSSPNPPSLLFSQHR